MKIQKLDISVAVLAGFACLALLVKLPVWAIFIGWAWYFALGAEPIVFKKAIPPLLLGYVMAAVSIFLYALNNNSLLILCGSVMITVFIIMLSLKMPMFSHSLVSFSAYSCMFAGYYAVNFPQVESGSMNIINLLICIGWLAMSNLIGLLFGFLSVKLSRIGEN